MGFLSSWMLSLRTGNSSIESGQWEIVRERHVRAEVEAWLQRHVQEWLQQGVDSRGNWNKL